VVVFSGLDFGRNLWTTLRANRSVNIRLGHHIMSKDKYRCLLLALRVLRSWVVDGFIRNHPIILSRRNYESLDQFNWTL